MREYNFQLEESFKAGLRRLDRGACNTQNGLVECYNARVGSSGLEEYVPLAEPFTGLPVTSWPKPQLFDTKSGIFVGGSTDIYYMNSDYSLSSVVGSLTGTGPWQMADFGAYQVWTNGSETVERKGDTGIFALKPMKFSMETVCNFRGQLVAGGFTGDTARVAWGEIGRVRLDDLVWADQDLNTAIGTAGSMPMRWRGTVYNVKTLGNGIVVYGSKGITALRAFSEPSVTFGEVWTLPFGISNRNAIGGDESQHLFVDEYNWLWRITSDFKVEKLGYQEFMGQLGTIYISFDSNKGDFYISDGTYCFLYAEGLSQVYQCPSGITTLGGSLVGILSEGSDLNVYVTTDRFDCYNRGIKTVSGIDVSAYSLGTLYVSVDYRFSTNESFTQSDWRELSHEGFGVPNVGAVEFRICLKTDQLTDFTLANATIRWKQTDKRSIRGIYSTDVRNKTSKTIA